ncbi:MAG: NADAR family protein [Candidatus Ornithomonoglobus sp.]
MKQTEHISEESITNFHKDGYEFLSNFYEASITFNGLTYGNAEAAFQAQKVLDNEERMKFCRLTPNIAKKRGRKVQLRTDWEEIKLELMYEIVKSKFEQNPKLAQKLLATGEQGLVEGNT